MPLLPRRPVPPLGHGHEPGGHRTGGGGDPPCGAVAIAIRPPLGTENMGKQATRLCSGTEEGIMVDVNGSGDDGVVDSGGF